VLAAVQKLVMSRSADAAIAAPEAGEIYIRHAAGMYQSHTALLKSWLRVPSQRAGQAAGYS
jgi:hypothetical protein